MNVTRKQWRDYHYGKAQQKRLVSSWMLLDHGDVIVRGNYALCVHVMKQRQAQLKYHNLKIVPNE